jgi:hypothetical protein
MDLGSVSLVLLGFGLLLVVLRHFGLISLRV